MIVEMGALKRRDKFLIYWHFVDIVSLSHFIVHSYS